MSTRTRTQKAADPAKTPSRSRQAKPKPTESEVAEASKAFAPSYTVKQLEAMSRTELDKALITERSSGLKPGDEGAVVQNWMADPKSAAKVEAKAKKATTPRMNFAVIPYPRGKSEYNLETQTHKCAGEPGPSGHKPGAVLPIKKFPTTTPDKRTEECRGCRDYRQNRAARAEAGTAYVVKPKETAETPKAEGKTAKATTTKAEGKAKAADKAPSAPSGAAGAPDGKAKAAATRKGRQAPQGRSEAGTKAGQTAQAKAATAERRNTRRSKAADKEVAAA